jgi:hypothetical protein
MKQIFDRIAYSFVGIILLIILEGIATLGLAFKFEQYNWMGVVFQSMLLYLAIYAANKIYNEEKK